MKLFLIMIMSMELQAQWIDPHDMNSRNIDILKFESSTSDTNTKTEEITDLSKSLCKTNSKSLENITLTYLKRIVNLLLMSTVIDKNDMKIRNGKFTLNIEDDYYKFLVKFSTHSEEINIEKLRELDSILSNIFKRTVRHDISDFVLTLKETFYYLIFNVTTLVLLGIVVAFFVTYQLLQANFPFSYVLKYFIMIVFIIDYGVKYKHLLEVAEEQNMKIVSESCKELNWWIYLFSSTINCEKKTVSPLDVALLQVKSLIIIPLSSLGTGMGEFAKELWGNLPFPWNILIFPIMLLFIAILVAIITTSINGSLFKINLMHLFHLEFGQKQRDDSTSDHLNTFLKDVIHRPMIESTRKSPDKQMMLEAENKTIYLVEKRSLCEGKTPEPKIIYEKANCDLAVPEITSSDSSNFSLTTFESQNKIYSKKELIKTHESTNRTIETEKTDCIKENYESDNNENEQIEKIEP